MNYEVQVASGKIEAYRNVLDRYKVAEITSIWGTVFIINITSLEDFDKFSNGVGEIIYNYSYSELSEENKEKFNCNKVLMIYDDYLD